MSILSSLPPVLERHELKYTIPFSYLEPITQFLQPYCLLDYHSAQSESAFYVVNSLYFDTHSLQFLQQRMYGKDGRFNIRARCYGGEGKPPYFLEIKQKQGVSGVKYRAQVHGDEWPYILTDPSFRVSDGDSAQQRINKERFVRIATAYDISPKLLTQYKRRAFISTVDEYARVTMDVSMKYRRQDHYELKPDDTMVSYDNETIYSNHHNSDAMVILELKCNIGQVPTWMLDLIALFELKQQGFSKYLSSSLVSYRDNGLNYMSNDRMVGYA